MSTITLKRDCNPKQIEDLLGQVGQSSLPVNLRLPNSLKESGNLGIEAHLILLIATWLRSSTGTTTFHSFVDDNYSALSFEDLCSRMYGICVLALADELVTARGSPVSRRLALETAATRIQNIRQLKFKSAFKGSYVGIPCIKAPGYQKELNSPFYNNDAVVGRAMFYKITDRAIASIVPAQLRNRLVTDELLTNLSEIVRELFTNTDRHARRDETGNILSKNFRCVIFNFSPVSESRIDAWVRSGGGYKLKFASNWKSPFQNNAPRVLEVSVVDTGPGFARRWIGRPKEQLSLEEEKEAVTSCFAKYRTTDVTPSSGSGLTRVLTDIRRLRGWFRLRTGSVVVERSFLTGTESLAIEKDDVFETKAFADGTAATFLIPLSIDQNK